MSIRSEGNPSIVANRPFGLASRRRDGAHQPQRIGMFRGTEDHLAGCGLDQRSCIHHSDIVGDSCHDPHIMGHVDHRHAGLALQIADQVQDLRLDSDV